MRILVLNAGALHSGYLGCYGSERTPTANLGRLAAEGVVFDRHYADCPRRAVATDMAQGSAWTGRFQPPLAARETGTDSEADPDATLLNILRKKNIAAAAFALSDWDPRRVAPALKILGAEHRALVWLDLPSLAPPWTVSAECFDALVEDGEAEELSVPWLDPPIGSLQGGDLAWERLQRTYAAVISQFDAWIGSLLQKLEDRKLYDEVLLILTADCGLALGEHGVVGPYRAWLHEEVWQVPLVLKMPGVRSQESGVRGQGSVAGRRIGALTQAVDLFPTMLETFAPDVGNLADFRSLHGLSLWPLVRGEAEQIRPYVLGGLQIGDSVECALRTPDWAFLLPLQVPEGDPPRSPRLYVKPDDRWEANDVRQHHPDLVEQLEKTLRERLA